MIIISLLFGLAFLIFNIVLIIVNKKINKKNNLVFLIAPLFSLISFVYLFFIFNQTTPNTYNADAERYKHFYNDYYYGYLTEFKKSINDPIYLEVLNQNNLHFDCSNFYSHRSYFAYYYKDITDVEINPELEFVPEINGWQERILNFNFKLDNNKILTLSINTLPSYTSNYYKQLQNAYTLKSYIANKFTTSNNSELNISLIIFIGCWVSIVVISIIGIIFNRRLKNKTATIINKIEIEKTNIVKKDISKTDISKINIVNFTNHTPIRINMEEIMDKQWEELSKENKKFFINDAMLDLLYEKLSEEEKSNIQQQAKDKFVDAKNVYINKNNQEESTEEKTNKPVHIPTWEELSKEEQNEYIKKSIKQLYKNQLADSEYLTIITREQRAIKRDSLEMEEFLQEDLTEEELTEVLNIAKSYYENKDKQENVEEDVIIDKETFNKKTEKNIEKSAKSKEVRQSDNGKLIRKGFKWFLYCFIGTKLGKVTSFTDEKSGYDFRYLNFGMKLVVSTLWEGYKIEKEDVSKYSIKPSYGLKERCIITLKNGKKISVDLVMGASEKITMSLGADLLEE